MKKAFVFDFDGVITDGIPIQTEAFLKVFNEVGLDLTVEYLHSTIGMTPRQVIAKIVAEHSLSQSAAELVERLHSYLVEAYDQKAQLAPGLVALLERLKHLKLAVGVASATESDILLQVLNKFEIRDYVSSVVGGEVLARGKPDPEMLIKCLTELQVPPAEAFEIDDARSGILAANSIGMFSIAYTFYSKHDIPEAKLQVTDFADIPIEHLL